MTEITIMHTNPIQEFTASYDTGTEPVHGEVCIPPADSGIAGSAVRKTCRDHAPGARHPVDLDDILIRATRLNAELRLYGVDIVNEEELVLTAGTLSEGTMNPVQGATGPLIPGDALVGKTLSHLRHGYRRILIREDLPPGIAKEVLAVAQLLDKTAGSMGFY
jgi:hypothetical protein